MTTGPYELYWEDGSKLCIPHQPYPLTLIYDLCRIMGMDAVTEFRNNLIPKEQEKFDRATSRYFEITEMVLRTLNFETTDRYYDLLMWAINNSNE
jgi:hypothetical protein